VAHRATGFLVAAMFALFYYLSIVLGSSIGWPPEVWTGSIVLSCLPGLSLAVLMQRA
jgi:hypothetical protein